MKILAIIRKELQTYFFSPAAYIVFASFFLVVGYLFYVVMISQRIASLEPLLYNAAFVLLLVSPILTMRLISDERKSNTMELLLTSPISPTEIVMGKFLSSLVLYLILVVLSLQYPIIMIRISENVDMGPIYSGYIGILLLGASFISFGLFASSLSDNQVISAVVAFGGLLMFWMCGWAKHVLDNALGTALGGLSIFDRYADFLRGIVDSGNVVFFIVFISVWLFLATRVVESDRWR